MMAQMPVDTYAVPEGFDLEGFDLDGDSDDLSDSGTWQNGGQPEELERMEPENGMRL